MANCINFSKSSNSHVREPRISYSVEEIRQMKDLPLSYQEPNLPEWFMHQNAKRSFDLQHYDTHVAQSIVTPQVRPVLFSRGYSYAAPAYMSRSMLGRSDEESSVIEIQRSLNDLSFSPNYWTNATSSTIIVSPRTNFHQRRTVQMQPTPYLYPITRMPMPVPYVKKFGHAPNYFPEAGQY